MTLLGAAVLVALLFWLLGGKGRRAVPGPEDDVEAPVDESELAQAESELAEDERARPLHDGMDDEDDDWGPGRP